ncbi:MDR family MFS transporter [Pseudomonas aeruginosa]|nr:MDR family MFS transporter [Pseudomonas aeruginosa]
MTAEALARPLGEPTRRDWIAVLSAMLGAFMAVLDIQITNSSLKDIQGALAATLEEGSWISTSYLVAEIIMIPMTAWLVQLLSARRLAVMISVGFLVSSLLCSFAWNLESMIVFRAMQGFTGGALIPLAFTLALVKLPEHHRPKGMALFAITATFAPSIGPTLGGWLTENFGWEYIFYINVPPGLLMIAGLLYGLEKKAPRLGTAEEYRLRRHRHPRHRPGLPAGFPRGRSPQDWLESQLIVSLGSVALFSLVLFVILQLSRPNPLIDLGILRNRNFGLASISSIGLGMGLYGSIYVLPLYLAQIQGYNAMQIGEVIMWMGIPQLFLIPLVPKVDEAGLAAPALRRRLRPVRPCQLLLRGAQPGLRRTAVQPDPATARPRPADDHGDHFADRHRLPAATGCRLGLEPVQHPAQPRRRHRHRPARDPARQSRQVYFDYLREALVPTNPQVDERLAQLAAQLGSQQAALGKLSEITHQQAMIMAYNDAFHVIGMVLAVSMLAVLLTRSLPAGIGARADAGGSLRFRR